MEPKFYPLAPSVFPEGTSLGGQMMKMLKLLGLMVFVVCIAAFASGCGGGGGGSSMDTETPTMPTEPTEPATPAEPETPEPTIADIRATVLGILTGASELANTVAASATAIGESEDVTEAQLSLAVTWHQNAQNAVSQIIAANNLATSATTLEEAQQALSAARTALTSLQTAQTQLASIQADLTPVAATPPATPPTTPAEGATPGTFTNNSSLIEFLQNNERASTAILTDLHNTTTGPTRISVGTTGTTTATTVDTASTCAAGTTGCAKYPYYKDPTVASKVSGVLNVEAHGESSNNNTGKLTGPSIFSFGFDLKDEDAAQPARFVNAYTDIKKETRTGRGTTESPYVYTHDPDYLLLGVWLDVTTQQINAFAYGNQPVLASSTMDFCDGTSDDRASTTGTSRVCGTATGNFHQINDFVPSEEVVNATYTGNANGAYIAGRNSSYFHASVEFKAEFKNGGAANGTGWIEGKVSNFNVGGVSVAGNIDLIRHTFTDGTINGDLTGIATGPVGEETYQGSWKGQFYSLRSGVKSSPTTSSPGDTPTVITTTYAPGAPGTVAGTFYATQQTEPNGDAGIIGAFGAHR